MVMGRNGYGPILSWAEMVMGRNDSYRFSAQRFIAWWTLLIGQVRLCTTVYLAVYFYTTIGLLQ